MELYWLNIHDYVADVIYKFFITSCSEWKICGGKTVWMCECLIWRWVEMKQRWKEKSLSLQMLGCSILFHSRAGWQMCCEIPRFTDHYSFRATLLLQSWGLGEDNNNVHSFSRTPISDSAICKRKSSHNFTFKVGNQQRTSKLTLGPPTCPILSGSELGKITLAVLIKTGHRRTKYPPRFRSESEANIMKYVNQVIITTKLNWRSEATLHCVTSWHSCSTYHHQCQEYNYFWIRKKNIFKSIIHTFQSSVPY